MGLEIQHVLSDESHYGVFDCPICQQLIDLDAFVTVSCSHAFCANCLGQWLQRSSLCPTCNQNLLYANNQGSNIIMIGDKPVTVQPLYQAQPLAHRSLKRVQVSCPFSSLGCNWKGDYGDLQAHVSKTTHQKTEDPVNVRIRSATMFKEEANNQFSSGHFPQAQEMYSKGIATLLREDLDEESKAVLAALYANRSATQLVMRNFHATEDDAARAIEIDPTYVKAYIRRAKALVQLGRISEALRVLEDGSDIVTDGKDNKQLQKAAKVVRGLDKAMAVGVQELENEQYASAKTSFSQLLAAGNNYLSQSLEAPNVLLGAARADLGLGLTDSVLRLTMQVIKKHPHATDAYVVRGYCYLMMTEYKSGISLMKEALRRDPDANSAQKSLKESKAIERLTSEIGDDLFHRRFDQVVNKVTETISICKLLPPKSLLYSWLHTQRATAHFRRKDFQKSLKDCALVLYHREDHVDAWLIRFQALGALERYDEALELSSDLLQKWGANDYRIRKAYETADFEVRKRKRPDFYAMLGVSSIASEREIKKAYRQKAMEIHPDRLVGKTEQEQAKAKCDFQLLSNGLEILTDDFTKELYDKGYDIDAIKERVEAAKHAAHSHRNNYHHH